jgi:hypothetical protein
MGFFLETTTTATFCFLFSSPLDSPQISNSPRTRPDPTRTPSPRNTRRIHPSTYLGHEIDGHHHLNILLLHFTCIPNFALSFPLRCFASDIVEPADLPLFSFHTGASQRDTISSGGIYLYFILFFILYLFFSLLWPPRVYALTYLPTTVFCRCNRCLMKGPPGWSMDGIQLIRHNNKPPLLTPHPLRRLRLRLSVSAFHPSWTPLTFFVLPSILSICFATCYMLSIYSSPSEIRKSDLGLAFYLFFVYLVSLLFFVFFTSLFSLDYFLVFSSSIS